MIDSVAAHSSPGSSWPTLLSPLQGDLVSTACALPATAAAWRLPVWCGLMRVWVMWGFHLSRSGLETPEKGKRPMLRQRSTDWRECPHLPQGDHPRDLSWLIVSRSKGPEPMVNSRTIWGYIYHPRQAALQSATCISWAGEVAWNNIAGVPGASVLLCWEI